MATPLFLPDAQFETFGNLDLSVSNNIDLGSAAEIRLVSFVFSRLSALNSGIYVDRPAGGRLKAVRWDPGWVVLKVNGSVEAFSSVLSSSTSSPVYREVPDVLQSDVVNFSAGGSYLVAIKSDGSLVDWDLSGGVGLPLPAGSFIDVSVAGYSGRRAGVGLKADGSVVVWSDIETDPAIAPNSQDVISVCVNFEVYSSSIFPSFLALKRDGTVYGWGRSNVYNFIDTNIVRISRNSSVVSGIPHWNFINDQGQVKFATRSNYNTVTPWYEAYAVDADDGFFITKEGDLVDHYGIGGPVYVLSKRAAFLGGLDRLSAGGATRLDGSVVLFGIARYNNGLPDLAYNFSQYKLPDSLRLSVNSIGSNDFSFVYDGNVKKIIPNYEQPLGRNVISANTTPTNPVNAGTYVINYSVSDISYRAALGDATGVLVITAGAPIIAAGQILSGIQGEFNKAASLTDALNRPVTSWSATELPSWASINATTGAITGTPQDIGSTTITLTAAGPGGQDTASATILVAAGPPIISAGQSFAGKVGVAFLQTLSLDDALNRAATSWSATGLPAGLELNAATGEITGTPTAKGNFSASFRASNSVGAGNWVSISFGIAEGVPVVASQSASAIVGFLFSFQLLSNDSIVDSWSAVGLPAWASLNSETGVVSGVPVAGGGFSAEVTASGPSGSGAGVFAVSVVSALIVSWPGAKIDVGQEVQFFAISGLLPSGVLAGVYYFVHSSEVGKFTISQTLGGLPITTTGVAAGSFKARLREGRFVRGMVSGISHIGMLPGGVDGEVEANSINLWGYNYDHSASVAPAGAFYRLLKSEDIDYNDITASDWRIYGNGVPSVLDGASLRSEVAIKHYAENGAYIANWPTGGDVLVDIDGRNFVDIKNITLGDLSIVPGFSGGLQVSMRSYLDGGRVVDNMCGLYMKFFDNHLDSSIAEYRGGGGGWLQVLEFGENPNSVRVPVSGAYAIYKIVRGLPEQGLGPAALVSVSLRIKMRD